MERFDVFRCAIQVASHAAISMVVQLEAYGLEARFWTTFAFRAECSLSFNQPTCTASIETEPPSTPSTGNVSGSDGVRVPAT